MDQLGRFWMHRDRLLWARVKAAVAAQAGVIAGWYYAMTDDLGEVALPVAVLGLVLTASLALLAAGDLLARNVIGRRLREVNAAAPFPMESAVAGALALGLIFGILTLGGGAMTWTSWKYPHAMAAPVEDGYDSTGRFARVNAA